MEHIEIVECLSIEVVILLYNYWYLSLSKNALYTNWDKRNISLLFFVDIMA